MSAAEEPAGLLDDVLSRALPAGVHRWHDAPAADVVRRRADDARWSWVEVDTAGLDRRRDVVGAIVAALGATSGAHNLDALHDVARHVVDRQGPTLLWWTGWRDLAEADGSDGLARVVRVLARADDLEVVLAGHGPGVGLDDLVRRGPQPG